MELLRSLLRVVHVALRVAVALQPDEEIGKVIVAVPGPAEIPALTGDRLQQLRELSVIETGELVNPIVDREDPERLRVVEIGEADRDNVRARLLRCAPAVLAGDNEPSGLLDEDRPVEPVLVDALADRGDVAAARILRMRLDRVDRDSQVLLPDRQIAALNVVARSATPPGVLVDMLRGNPLGPRERTARFEHLRPVALVPVAAPILPLDDPPVLVAPLVPL